MKLLKGEDMKIQFLGIKRTKMYKSTMYVSILSVLLVCSTLSADTVSELQTNYSGSTDWNSGTGTLTFTSTGTINFPAKVDYKNNYWDVPLEVSKIIINANVTVTGAFHTFYTCTIEGVDRYTSVVFGTNEQRWADNRGLDEWHYCQFQNWGGVLTVKNLTGLNPFAYFIRGWNKVNHAKSCDFIDDRGGWSNHSDGFSGGHGSTVDDCYFETGDDIIKCYFDITVTNTTINMIQNSVPFQFGWGTYQDSHSVLSDITITGDWGRGPDFPVFQWKSGSDYKFISMNRVNIQNPNAAIFDLESSGTLYLDITNSYINVEEYGTASFTGTRTICGTTSQTNLYDCILLGDLNRDDGVDYGDVVELSSGWQGLYDMDTLGDIAMDWLEEGAIPFLYENQNLVLPANGGVLQSFTSEYGGEWVASDLTNEVTNEAGWASAEDPNSSQEFIFSFRDGNSATLIEAVIHGGTAESQYYSKDVEVWTSPDGSSYSLAGDGTLANSNGSTVTVDLTGIVAKKIKLVIRNGYRTDYWELAEFMVSGVVIE